MGATATSALAEPPLLGWDDTFVVDVCPFPLQIHQTGNWFKEIITPQGPQDHRDGCYVEFTTNLDTGVTWRVPGNPVTSFTFKPDGTFNPEGSVIQTIDGVWVAAGPLHTIYFGHWTRTFPDGVFGPVPFEGHEKKVDICERLS
jgi:hypothetical protein